MLTAQEKIHLVKEFINGKIALSNIPFDRGQLEVILRLLLTVEDGRLLFLENSMTTLSQSVYKAERQLSSLRPQVEGVRKYTAQIKDLLSQIHQPKGA